MGQRHPPMGGPADAGRAFVASDRVSGLAPAGFNPSLALLGCRLRAGGAARSACPSHTTALPSCAARPSWLARRLFSLATAAPSRGRGADPVVRLAAHGGPRRGAESAFSWSTAFRFVLQSRQSLLSRSPAAGLDRRRCASPATRHASGQAVTISSPLRGRLR